MVYKKLFKINQNIKWSIFNIFAKMLNFDHDFWIPYSFYRNNMKWVHIVVETLELFSYIFILKLYVLTENNPAIKTMKKVKSYTLHPKKVLNLLFEMTILKVFKCK